MIVNSFGQIPALGRDGTETLMDQARREGLFS